MGFERWRLWTVHLLTWVNLLGLLATAESANLELPVRLAVLAPAAALIGLTAAVLVQFHRQQGRLQARVGGVA
jgi:hypothetical protein